MKLPFHFTKTSKFYIKEIEKEVMGDKRSSINMMIFYLLNNFIWQFAYSITSFTKMSKPANLNCNYLLSR